MKYANIVKAEFISRPNRFVAHALLNGEEVTVHVKNTGRCRELLVPGAEIYLEDFSGRQGKRKLLYDLITVKKGELLINIDSQAPNKVACEALKSGALTLPGLSDLAVIKPETTFGDSRFDFYLKDIDGREGFMEVKGVTLESGGIASFPDAPTERGIKHLNELVKAHREGFCTYVLFVVQMEGMKHMTPNDERHPAFGEALRNAAENGVNILAFECSVTPDSLDITRAVPVRLQMS